MRLTDIGYQRGSVKYAIDPWEIAQQEMFGGVGGGPSYNPVGMGEITMEGLIRLTPLLGLGGVILLAMTAKCGSGGCTIPTWAAATGGAVIAASLGLACYALCRK